MKCVILNERVFVYGGFRGERMQVPDYDKNDLFELNLTTFQWTKLADHSDKR